MKFNLDFQSIMDEEPDVDPAGTTLSDVAWNMTISFFVICISLVPASQAILNDINLDLAQSSQSAPPDPDTKPLRVTIDATGRVKLEGSELGLIATAADALPAALKQLLASRASSEPAWVIPDQSVDWKDIVPIAEAVQSVTDNFSFITKTEEEVQE